MIEPASACFPGGTAGGTLLSALPGVDVAVVVGALLGAGASALASNNLSPRRRAAFFLISFGAGCVAAHVSADLIARALMTDVHVSPAVGALLAAATVDKVLLALMRRIGNLERKPHVRRRDRQV